MGRNKIQFDMALIKEIRAGSVAGRTDIEIAIALSQLVHDELQAFGTEGGQSLNDAQIAAALTALRAVTRRLAIQFDPPYRNFTTFKSYWMRNDAYGSWQARRNFSATCLSPYTKSSPRWRNALLTTWRPPSLPMRQRDGHQSTKRSLNCVGGFRQPRPPRTTGRLVRIVLVSSRRCREPSTTRKTTFETGRSNLPWRRRTSESGATSKTRCRGQTTRTFAV